MCAFLSLGRLWEFAIENTFSIRSLSVCLYQVVGVRMTQDCIAKWVMGFWWSRVLFKRCSSVVDPWSRITHGHLAAT